MHSRSIKAFLTQERAREMSFCWRAILQILIRGRHFMRNLKGFLSTSNDFWNCGIFLWHLLTKTKEGFFYFSWKGQRRNIIFVLSPQVIHSGNLWKLWLHIVISIGSFSFFLQNFDDQIVDDLYDWSIQSLKIQCSICHVTYTVKSENPLGTLIYNPLYINSLYK